MPVTTFVVDGIWYMALATLPYEPTYGIDAALANVDAPSTPVCMPLLVATPPAAAAAAAAIAAMPASDIGGRTGADEPPCCCIVGIVGKVGTTIGTLGLFSIDGGIAGPMTGPLGTERTITGGGDGERRRETRNRSIWFGCDIARATATEKNDHDHDERTNDRPTDQRDNNAA